LVVALGQVVRHELLEQVAQVSFAEDDEVIQALSPDGLHEALRVWVAVWALRRSPDAPLVSLPLRADLVLSQTRSPGILAELRRGEGLGWVGSGDRAVCSTASVPDSSGRELARCRQGQAIEFLRTENRVLRARLGPRRLRFTDAERRLLAEAGKPLGRSLLAEMVSLATPETILRWYRESVAAKYDGSRAPDVDHDGFSRAIVSSCFVTSLAVGGLPGERRVSGPSYFAAIIRRYQRRIVSDVARVASSASMVRPSRSPFSARSRRSASVNCRRAVARRSEHPVLGLQVRDGQLLPPMDPTGHQKDQKLEWGGRLRRSHGRAR
jgi:hypothetical protein